MNQMRNTVLFLTAITILFLSSGLAQAQNPVSWQLETDARDEALRNGHKFKATLKAAIEGDWHMYALDQPEGEGPRPTRISIPDGTLIRLTGNITAPKPLTKFDPNFNIQSKFYTGSVQFELPLGPMAAMTREYVAVKVYYQVCNDTMCLPPKTVRVTLAGFEDEKKTGAVVNSGTPLPGDVILEQGTPAKDVISKPADAQNIWSFLWLAITVGALSLLTPCVFPMIPITVSYFTNHAAGSRAKALKLASVYSLGIIATFTLLGMLLAFFVGAAGINLFAANPWVNLLITAIFLFFAFNLFGAYEITVPSSVLTKLDKLTRSKEGEGSGIIGALLMGLTFTLTSFTCTSPFVGTLLVSTAQGSWQMPLLGMLAFSTVFALPFFILALMPQLVSQLPRAGGWMNSIKVAMGFLEVAAAMKFISNVDLIWKWGIFTRGVVLSIWIAIGVILSLYLLGKFQLFHDSKPERIGALRLVSAIISLAISFYLLTGLFGAKLGELESFLPPETNASRSFFNSNKDELVWIENDYRGALAKAQAEDKRVFIDFTGYTCTNCRWMEANVFNKPEIEAELKKFVLVRLYTDGEGEVYEKQQDLEQGKFGTVALPYYAVLLTDGNPVATFPGLTRNVDQFVQFLQDAQKPIRPPTL
jgi:thiol:disulfide interchange protein DsbD